MIHPLKIIIATLLCFVRVTEAQVTYTVTTFADAFLATGSANNPVGTDLTGLNFGGAGALLVAPPASAKGEFQTLLGFDLSGAVSLFNTSYGSNNWSISSLSLELTGNFATNGVQPNNMVFPVVHEGKFVIEWLSNDAWVEGTGTPNLPTTDGVTYDSLPDLLSEPHKILCTNIYTPPGDNVHLTYDLPLNTNLVSDVTGGGEVTFRLYAADDQIGYLFNSYSYGRGNQPLIHVTAGLKAMPLEIFSSYFTNGLFHLTGTGQAGLSYQVQTNSDLQNTNWQTTATVTADNAGIIQFDDATPVNQPQHFYRLAH